MPTPPTILMSLLSSGVRAIRGIVAPPPEQPDATEFEALLSKAQAGEVSTGLPVRVAPGVKIELSDAQLERLALAADRAESAGAVRALAFVDGRALEIDIVTRTITREHAIEHARAVTGIDAIIDVGVTTEGAESAGDAPASALLPARRPDGDMPPLAPPSGTNRLNPSLLGVLSER